jgi:hypothetical protein
MEHVAILIQCDEDGNWFDALGYEIGAYQTLDETSSDNETLQCISFEETIHFLPRKGECKRLGIPVTLYPDDGTLWKDSKRKFAGTRIIGSASDPLVCKCVEEQDGHAVVVRIQEVNA